MKTTTAKDLMVPLEEYAPVSEEATLFEAVMAIQKAVLIQFGDLTPENDDF